MKKTKEELNKLRYEIELMKKKLDELTDDEIKLVTGGYPPSEAGGLYTTISQLSLSADSQIEGDKEPINEN